MKPSLIVSFTSYPVRIQAVPQVLESLYAQSMKPDRILLWLAEEQFPNHEADLPKALIDDAAAGKFELRWCDDLGSHKKYFYAMQEHAEDIIVTVDDDAYYHPDFLEKLLKAHERHPNAVVASTTTLVQLDENLHPLPITQWLFDFRLLTEPTMLLVAIGVGGVLYPPHSVDQRIFDEQLIYDTCADYGKVFADDLLLKAGEMLQHTPVLSVPSKTYYRLPNTQGTALANILPKEEHNNQSIKKIEERFRDEFSTNDRSRLREAVTALKQAEEYGANIKKHWLERPFRELERQFGYLLLPDAPSKPDTSDYGKIKDIARIAARVFTAYPAATSDDETARAIHTFRQELLDIPGIADLAETDVVIRGLIDYGEPLNLECHIIYHGIPIYMRSLRNWQSFLANHPNCDSIYRKSYETFLGNTEVKIGQAESILPKTEIDEWKQAYEEAIKDCTITHKVSFFGFMKRGLKKWARKIFMIFFGLCHILGVVLKCRNYMNSDTIYISQSFKADEKMEIKSSWRSNWIKKHTISWEHTST